MKKERERERSVLLVTERWPIQQEDLMSNRPNSLWRSRRNSVTCRFSAFEVLFLLCSIVAMTIAREKRPRAIVSDSNDIFTRDNECQARKFLFATKETYIQTKINILILQNSYFQQFSFTIFLIEEI